MYSLSVSIIRLNFRIIHIIYYIYVYQRVASHICRSLCSTSKKLSALCILELRCRVSLVLFSLSVSPDLQLLIVHCNFLFPQPNPNEEVQVHEINSDPVERQATAGNSNMMNIYEVLDKKNQNQTSSKCRRDLFAAFSQENSNPSTNITNITQLNLPSLVHQDVIDLAQSCTLDESPLLVQGEIHPYVYVGTAASLGHCCQPQICSMLLHPLIPEHVYYSGRTSNRSSGSSSMGTAHTNDNYLSPRSQQLSDGLPPPYRTLSHFGFNSPRLAPRLEHKHLPMGTECIRYRALNRGISYEEIFASSRYEQLCQPCFEHLVRLKPELQRRNAASSSSGDERGEDIISYASSSVTPRRLATLTELHDEDEYDAVYERKSTLRGVQICEVSTQTCSDSANNFLAQIDRFSFSQESVNPNYVPGQVVVQSPSSPRESATSVIHKSLPGMGTNVTEVLNFGNWQEQQEQHTAQHQESQQPLTERRITLEITQKFNADQQIAERQLMSRDERQRRKLEFEELWQDHVEYYGAKQEMQEKDKTSETAVYCTLPMITQVEEPLGNSQAVYICENQTNQTNIDEQADEAAQHHQVLPQIIQDFEQSLSVAGENLEKLMIAAKQLRTEEVEPVETFEEMPDESLDSGLLFRAINLVNIPDADETASILEPERIGGTTFSSCDDDDNDNNDNDNENDNWVAEEEHQDEKRDDEKPVTPSPEPIGKEKVYIECSHIDEKDVDEHEYVGNNGNPLAINLTIPQIVIDDVTEALQEDDLASASNENAIFSPLEREILERIETDRLVERESIFGRIDESIRNKLTACRMQSMVNEVEESFSTCTHVIRTPSMPTEADDMTPHLFQFNSEDHPSAYSMPSNDDDMTPYRFQCSSEPRPSAYSLHNIATPTSSQTHVRVIAGKTTRRSRSCSTSNGCNHSSSSSPSPSIGQSRQSLHRAISSTTFVYRTSPRKKRNFILENIRNVGKSRIASRSRKHIQKSISDAASICTFQAEQRQYGTRLWVSLPTSPRNAIGHKRQSASSTGVEYTTVKSTPSSYVNAKRRRQVGTSMSSALENDDNFQLEASLDGVQPEEEKRNNTNNSVYFSANDSATTETPSSQSVQQECMLRRLSGGMTVVNPNSETSTSLAELSYPSQISLEHTDQSLEDVIESNSQDDYNEIHEINRIFPNALSASTESDTDPGKLNCVDKIEDNENTASDCFGEINHLDQTSCFAFNFNQDQIEDDDMGIARSAIGISSTDYELNGAQACIDLHRNPSMITSDDSKELLLGPENVLHSHRGNESEDDDKPITSKAAARRNRRRMRNSKSSKEGKSNSQDTVVLDTKCTLRGDTLHITDKSLEDLQEPRCGLQPNHDPTYEIQFITEESEEEINALELHPLDVDLMDQYVDIDRQEVVENEELLLESIDSVDYVPELSPCTVDSAPKDDQVLEICQNEENQAKDMAL